MSYTFKLGFPLSLLLVLLVSVGSAQSKSEVWELPVETLKDTKRVALSPVRWKGSDWAWAVGGISATALCFVVDEDVQQWMQSHQSGFGDGLATYIGQPFGNSLYVVGGSFLVYVGGKISHQEKIAQPALTAFKATLIAGGATGLIKFLSHRTRPDEHAPADAFIWDGPSFSTENLSFISAHSATAFALASSLSTYYKDYPWVACVTYPLATVTAWSRVYDNRHWLSDVVGGAILGVFIGKTVASPGKYEWTVAPNRFGGTSVGFTYSF